MEILTAVNEKISTIKRKFLTEAGIHLYSGGATVLRPCDLYKYEKDLKLRKALTGCNIYIIARRRRISVHPHSLRINDGCLYGDFRLHGEDPFSYEEFPFSPKEPFLSPDGTPLRFDQVATFNQFGFDVRAADIRYGVGNYPAHVLIANSNHRLMNHTNVEVLYVGQAYGKNGERLATDRLRAHTTFQRILAESIEENPCDEVFLLLFRFEHARNIASTAGDFSVEPSANVHEEQEHLLKIGCINIDRKTRVTLAEAALINYFKPKYNIMHRDSFHTGNTKKLKTLKKLFSLDLTALLVEINTSNFGSKLYTSKAPAATVDKLFPQEYIKNWQSADWLRNAGLTKSEVDDFIAEMTHAHIARFPLYSAAERETFLHTLPWGDC